ncbi:MAG TPA: phospholipase D-like domain-containing protein [Polyangiaceae bacterium]
MDLIPAVPRRLRRVQERFVEGNRVTLLRDAAQAFPSMLEAIRGARRQVLLEMYWFDSDRTGRRFAEALADARSRGVEVAVIYDSLGSWEADPRMFSELKEAGAHVIEFNPMMPWKKRFRLARLSLRDHRKILVVDGEKGFTGGVNLADVWLPEEEEGQAWRDDMICVQGPAVSGLMNLFQRTWEREGGAPLRASPRGQGGSGPIGDQRVHVLGENYALRRREITSAYLLNIYRARSRVWLTNSYFVPDGTVTRALKRAARRGVDVRVILPAFSDVEIVRHASRAMWGGLMRSGVRLFEFYRSILHSKSAVIDGTWSTIGSFNLDYRSLRANLEVNVAVQDSGFGAVMEESFRKDLEHCREVDAHEFKFRPLGHRLLEVILYRFRKFL